MIKMTRDGEATTASWTENDGTRLVITVWKQVGNVHIRERNGNKWRHFQAQDLNIKAMNDFVRFVSTVLGEIVLLAWSKFTPSDLEA